MSGIRWCLKGLAGIDAGAGGELMGLLSRSDYGREAKPQIVWSDPEARAGLVAELFSDAETVIEFCARFDDPGLVSTVELLAVVAGQDIEMVADDDGAQRPQIRQGVATDRVISTVDPDTPPRAPFPLWDRYDGYKLHMSGLISIPICSAAATHATVHDATVLQDLLDNDPVPVAEVIADTHYGSGPTRQTMADQGIGLVAPAPPISNRAGLFSKAEFGIDLEAATITCPAGVTAAIPPPKKTKQRQVRFDGAAGGVGSFAVQIAKAIGATVTAVCSTGNVAMVEGLGADEVIDYRTDDFVTGGRRFDVMLDNVGNRTPKENLSVLNPGARYVAVSGPKANPWIGPMGYVLKMALATWRSDASFHQFVASPNREDLDTLVAMLADGRIVPAIDRVVGLDGLIDGMVEIGSGHAKAKIVIRPR